MGLAYRMLKISRKAKSERNLASAAGETNKIS